MLVIVSCTGVGISSLSSRVRSRGKGRKYMRLGDSQDLGNQVSASPSVRLVYAFRILYIIVSCGLDPLPDHTVCAIETVTITFRSVLSGQKRNPVPRTKNQKLNGLRARRR